MPEITVADVQARATMYQNNINYEASQHPGIPLPDHDNYARNGNNDAFNKANALVETFHDLSPTMQSMYDSNTGLGMVTAFSSPDLVRQIINEGITAEAQGQSETDAFRLGYDTIGIMARNAGGYGAREHDLARPTGDKAQVDEDFAPMSSVNDGNIGG